MAHSSTGSRLVVSLSLAIPQLEVSHESERVMDIAALEAQGFDESTREWRAGSNFTSRSGGLRILCELGTGPKRRSEFESALRLDKELLSNRLYAGIRFSIWVKEEVGADDGGTHAF